MAFGRSNSLSLNTGAANSSFASQQGQQPPAAGGLFGGGSMFGNQAQKPQTSSLFGAPATTQPTQTGGLFGAQPAATQSAPSGGLFGAQPTQTNSLFGNSQNQTKPATGLFGAAQSTAQPSGNLFGAQPAQPSGGLFGAAQPAQPSGGLFGGQSTAQPSGGLFGQAKPGGLFGSTQTTAQPSGGLFGAAQPTAQANSSLFGSKSNQPSGGLFGMSQANAQPAAAPQQQQQQQQQAASLLGASQYALGQPAPFTGRLTMGQGSAAQPSSIPATKIDWGNVRSTTRYADLTDSAKSSLEMVDKLIQQQEEFCKQIEAFLPAHNTSLNTLQPDIDLIKDKCDAAEQALITDAQGVQQTKTTAFKDHKDITRIERIVENFRLPSAYHYAPAATLYGTRKNVNHGDAAVDEEYDMNLVNNYFLPMAADMQKLFDTYAANLGEIESHMQTLDATAIAQAQALMQQRAGGSGQDQVRQLADTLRGFESTILATAAKVGTARDGVTELSLGKARGMRM